MTEVSYKRFTVRGISDKPECDICGKQNLKMTVIIENEAGELLHYGADCASTTLRQDYMGKRYKLSRDAVISMGRTAKRGEAFAKLSQQFTNQ
jgi:hypothetical protein